MRPRMRLSSVTLWVGLSLLATACTDWRVQDVEPAQWIAQTRPAEVQLERREGPRLRLRHPEVVGTEIRGVHGRDTVRVQLVDVTRLAVKRTDWAETALLIAAPPALFFALACLAGCGY